MNSRSLMNSHFGGSAGVLFVCLFVLFICFVVVVVFFEPKSILIFCLFLSFSFLLFLARFVILLITFLFRCEAMPD